MIKKILFAIIFILVIIGFISILCFFVGNGHNSIGNGKPDCQEWFTDTGVNVKNYQNRLYNIVRDGNGWLYYSTDVDGTLIPVVDKFGLPTKDTAVFAP